LLLPTDYPKLSAFEHTPEEIDEEDELSGCRYEDQDRDHLVERLQVLQIVELGHLSISPRIACHAEEVHRQKDPINADECEPEMEFAEPFTHHSAKHLREPEIGAGEYAEDRCHTHNQVEVADDKIGVVEVKVKRVLAEKDPAESACREERHKSDREEHWCSETELAAHIVPSQLKVLIADGTPIVRVTIENATLVYGLMPLMNMW